jgi:endonuclease G
MVLNGVFPTTEEKTQIICHKRFVIGYSIERKSPLWVAEKLEISQINAIKFKRVNAFKFDPLILPLHQSALDDFEGNEYDRGHLVPYEDVADDAEAAKESFFLTNIVPEFSDHNRGIWRAVEGRTRKLIINKQYVFIITGPIFDKEPATLKSGVPIPSHLFKFIVSPTTNESFTIIIPNQPGLLTAAIPKFFSTVDNLKSKNIGFNPIPGRHTFSELNNFN